MVDSEDQKVEKLKILINLLNFVKVEKVLEGKSEVDLFINQLVKRAETANLTFLSDDEKVCEEALKEQFLALKSQLQAENLFFICRQFFTKTYQFMLKMNLAKKVYSSVSVEYFDQFVNSGDLNVRDNVVALTENGEFYSQNKPRKELRGITKRIEQQRAIALKNVKRDVQAVQELEVSQDYEDDFFALDMEDYE